jgi:hypothetical protein
VTYRSNLFAFGQKCHASDKVVGSIDALGFVAPRATEPDLHLTPGSPAVDAGARRDFPARDIDGNVRPRGRAADAGADELR